MLFQHVKQLEAMDMTQVNWNRLEERGITKKDMHAISTTTKILVLLRQVTDIVLKFSSILLMPGK